MASAASFRPEREILEISCAQILCAKGEGSERQRVANSAKGDKARARNARNVQRFIATSGRVGILPYMDMKQTVRNGEMNCRKKLLSFSASPCPGLVNYLTMSLEAKAQDFCLYCINAIKIHAVDKDKDKRR